MVGAPDTECDSPQVSDVRAVAACENTGGSFGSARLSGADAARGARSRNETAGHGLVQPPWAVPERDRPAARLAVLAVALLTLLAACATTPLVVDDEAVLPAWRARMPAALAVRGRVLAADVPMPAMPNERAACIVDAGLRPSPSPLTAAQLRQLSAFVADGGRLCLFGHAARLVTDLGLEPEQPECEVHRWGFDRRAVAGDAEQLLFATSGLTEELFDGLEATVAEHAFAIAGGLAGCNLPLCSWRIGPAQKGDVLARFGEVRDGLPAPLGGPVLLRYRYGLGEVLACGLLPGLDHQTERVRENARGFVQRCVAWASRGQRTGIALLRLPDGPHVAPPAPATDGPAIVPLLAHWGWLVSLYDGDDFDAVRPVDELVRDAMLPAWRHGADLVQLELTDPQHGPPLAWSANDPIAAPSSYRGRAVDSLRGAAGLREFAEEAHGRGLLATVGLDPLPVGERPTERLVMLRRSARDLCDVRRHGAGAFDGFGLRQWFDDARGYGVAMVHDYQPSPVLFAAGERTPAPAGALRAMDAADGALAGLPYAGLCGGWRDGFAADEFPVGLLDAREAADALPGNGVRGGGSAPDWLVRQWNDFVRARRGLGGSVLWRRHDPRTLGARSEEYVHGLGLEPLRAAVAYPLAATGRGGLRQAGFELVDGAPKAYAAAVDAGCIVHALQNNWFQLLGSGGALRYDPGGLADFGVGAATLSPTLLRTRLFGGRPDGSSLLGERTDFLREGTRGEGGYGRVARVRSIEGAEQRVPGLLARDLVPSWPAAVEFDWSPNKGVHELRIRLRCRDGNALVAISLDGTLLRCAALRETGRAPEILVPVHVAVGGERALRVELLDGGPVAIDMLTTGRTGDVAVEADVSVLAGSVAQVVERSWSSYHEERVTFTALADVPGLVLRAQCVRCARGLQVERRLALPRHLRVAAATQGDDPNARREAFVLRADDPALPDVVVVPLQLPRHESLRTEAGEVVWRGAPEAGGTGRVGLLLWPHGKGQDVLPHAARLLDAIDRPLSLDLGPDRRARLSSDLPVAQSRLLQIENGAETPFLVQERGFWTWRCAQPALGGGAWLRVFQEPGDVVEVVGGPAVLARTRPGPGSLRVVALRDVEPHAATVHVLQPNGLVPPSIVMASDFDEVLLDGEPWAHWDGRTIRLPDVVGSRRVETARRAPGAPLPPHVRRTGAPLLACRFDRERRELVLEVARDPRRPDELPWTAVLGGPAPASVENGEIVAADGLHLADAMAAATADRAGTLIRFRSGRTVVRYTQWNEPPGR